MKRLLPVVLLALLAAGGLTACNQDDDAVATVDGHEVMNNDELDGVLDQVGDATDLLAAQRVRGTGNETLRSEWVTSRVLYYVVQTELLQNDLADQDVEVDDLAEAAGDVILASNLGSPQDPDEQPVTVDQLPSKLRTLYEDYFALYAAELGSLGADLQEIADLDPTSNTQLSQATVNAVQTLGPHLVELRQAADVVIDPAWGTWVVTDADSAIAPPEGPVTPSTTVPLAVPVGG